MKKISLFLLLFISANSLCAMDGFEPPTEPDSMGLGMSGDNEAPPVDDFRNRIERFQESQPSSDGLMEKANNLADGMSRFTETSTRRTEKKSGWFSRSSNVPERGSQNVPAEIVGQDMDSTVNQSNAPSAEQSEANIARTANRGLNLTANIDENGAVSFKGKYKRSWWGGRSDSAFDEMNALNDKRKALEDDFNKGYEGGTSRSSEMDLYLKNIDRVNNELRKRTSQIRERKKRSWFLFGRTEEPTEKAKSAKDIQDEADQFNPRISRNSEGFSGSDLNQRGQNIGNNEGRINRYNLESQPIRGRYTPEMRAALDTAKARRAARMQQGQGTALDAGMAKRTERVQQGAETSERMQNSAQEFDDNMNDLAETYKKRKWWKF